MIFKRYFEVAGIITLLLIPAIAQGAGISVNKADLITTLSGYHGLPDDNYLKKLDQADLNSTLQEIVDDKLTHTFVRSRAVYILGKLASPTDLNSYLRAKIKEEQNSHVRASMYDTIGKRGGDDTVDILDEGLYDSSEMVNMVSAKRLSIIGSEEAKGKLMQASTKAKSESMRKYMRKSVDRLDKIKERKKIAIINQDDRPAKSKQAEGELEGRGLNY
ncbi:MAG: HEAT repeat domain-containing protein [Nitrospinota bacterium]